MPLFRTPPRSGTRWGITASGITLPKTLTVDGSDGRVYKQITKMAASSTADDTRQDAVMQQLFGLVNRFLAQVLLGGRRLAEVRAEASA